MNRLMCLSATVALVPCFATPVASAAHAERPTGSGSPAVIAAPTPHGHPVVGDTPLSC